MLDNATLLSLVGIIAKEWCKWFPADVYSITTSVDLDIGYWIVVGNVCFNIYSLIVD